MQGKREGGRIGTPLSNPAGAGCGQRGWWRRVAIGRGWEELQCLAQPASRRPLLAGLQPLDLKECLSRPVVGARADDIAAKSLGRAGHCPAHWLGPAVDSQCHSSLPLNHCVCPVGTHPSERLWAINGEHCPRNPPASSSCSQPPPYPSATC